MVHSEEKKSVLKTVKSYLSSASDAFTRLYDRSIVCTLASRIRHGFLTLSTRAVGVFFITFGVYSFLIAMLITLFSDNEVAPSNIYGGVISAVCALPLLFSRGNISTILSASSFGSVLCDYLNIKRETLEKNDFTGHLSVCFILGVIFGAATVVFPFGSLILAIGATVMFCVILCTPEAGLTFMTVLLFFTDTKLHYALIGAMLLSYIFKLIRKKRKLTLKKTDVVFFIFALATLGGVLFTTGDASRDGAAASLWLLSPYIIAVLFLRDARKITKLLTATVISAGTLSALYILGVATAQLCPADTVVDRGYLIRLISSLPAFESGFAPLGISSLIPVCTAFIIKPRNEGYRFTLILCLASMITCLFMTQEFAFVICAFIATALLLLITGSRTVYLTLAAILSTAVTLIYAGSLGDRIYSYIFENIYEAYHKAESVYFLSDNTVFAEYILCGQGFSRNASGQNFYYSLISQLGIAGFVIFVFLLLFVVLYAVGLILKTYRREIGPESLERFSSVVNRAETRMGIIAVVCSLFSVLLTATFYDFYKSELSYLTLFLIMGICSAYTRSAVGEITKAEGSLLSRNSKERASAAISRQHNQGGIK